MNPARLAGEAEATFSIEHLDLVEGTSSSTWPCTSATAIRTTITVCSTRSA
jgi:hypothetical protein